MVLRITGGEMSYSLFASKRYSPRIEFIFTEIDKILIISMGHKFESVACSGCFSRSVSERFKVRYLITIIFGNQSSKSIKKGILRYFDLYLK